MNLDFIPTLITPDTGIAVCDYASQMDFVGNTHESRELPAVFYHLFKEQAQPNQHIGLIEQQAIVMIALKIVAKNKLLNEARKAVSQALLGYTPDQPDLIALTPIEYVGGEVVEVDKRVIWWRDIYQLTVLKTERT